MCDTMAIVLGDRVLFAKNSDRDPNEAQCLEWHPRAEHVPGARLRCTWIEIPQAATTHAVLISRPYWMWGAEMGTNEHGLTIGNEAVFTRQPYAMTGLTGMDLLRLALERATSAEAGVEVITSLLAAHGQGGGCGHEHRSFTYHNSFLLADPGEAYVLETAGRQWALERVTGARSISNGLTIGDFARQHSDVVKTRVSACHARRARTQGLCAGAVSPSMLAAILRDHGHPTGARDLCEPRYRWLNGAMSAPCMHAGGALAASQTTASWIAELRADGCRHWATATAAPCTGLFKPIALAEPLELGRPADRYDAHSLWWRHERLHRRVMTDPARLAPLFAEERDALECEWFDQPPRSAEAFATADDCLAAWTAAVDRHLAADRRPALVRRYWEKRNRRAGIELTRTATCS